MKELFRKFAKKELTLLLVAILIIGSYLLFLKPNPPIRVNWNRIQIRKGDATLYIDAPRQINGVGKKFQVDVKLDTKGYVVNAVQSYITYDPRVLEIVKTDTQDSFCKFYPENHYNNDEGLIKLSCGAPYPGFRGENTVQTIEFLGKAIRTTEIKLTKDSMVLANDGKGTNILKDIKNASLAIKAGL